MQLVGQIVRHLGGEARSFASGRYLQRTALADEGGLPPGIVANGDLVGSVPMDVSKASLLCILIAAVGSPGSRNSAAMNIQRLLGPCRDGIG